MKDSRTDDSIKKEDDENTDYKYKIFNRRRPDPRVEHSPVSEETPRSEGTPPPCGHRSPVDVLIKVFPRRGRQEIEGVLARCKGDVVLAMEALVGAPEGSPSSYPTSVGGDSPPYCPPGYPSKSAFSPLSGQNFKFSPSRRFLTPPYSGTGYLPTVIRPPPPPPRDYLAAFLPPSELMYPRTMEPSPAASPRSDHTNTDGYSD